MNKNSFFAELIIITGFLSIIGCTTIRGINQETNRKTVLTGIYGNDLKKIDAAYDAVEVGMTEEQIVKLGFNHNAPNVQTFEGSDGARYMFGTEQMRPTIDGPAKYKEHILELEKYKTRLFPHVQTETLEEGSFWSSSKTKDKGGIERYYIFIYYEGKLLTKKKSGAPLLQEKEQEEKSILGGIFNKIIDLGGRVGRRF